jgi:hypothetical protein
MKIEFYVKVSENENSEIRAAKKLCTFAIAILTFLLTIVSYSFLVLLLIIPWILKEKKHDQISFDQHFLVYTKSNQKPLKIYYSAIKSISYKNGIILETLAGKVILPWFEYHVYEFLQARLDHIMQAKQSN